MKFFTSYFSNVPRIRKATSLNVKFVNISVFPPDGWNQHDFTELEPSGSLLKATKAKKMTQQQYAYIYKEKLSSLSASGIIDKTKRLYPDADAVVFLCYELPSKVCHRHIFREWMIQNDIQIQELPNTTAALTKTFIKQ